MIENSKTLVWKTQSSNAKIASIRYRCLLPALYLTELGYKSVVIQKKEVIDYFDDVLAIIFVKTFSEHDYFLALRAQEHGVPVILDLCDNIFVDNYSNSKNIDQFIAMSKIAAFVITTGHELQSVLGEFLDQSKLVVIPDQIETLASVRKINAKLRAWRLSSYRFMKVANKLARFVNLEQKLASFKQYIRLSMSTLYSIKLCFDKPILQNYHCKKAKSPHLKRLIWFGNHGAQHSNFGMGSLLMIQKNLEEINKIIPIELLIVSNSKEKFNNLIRPFLIKTRYKKWNVQTIFKDIAGCDLCILPSYNDEFSLSKSANRTLLSLSLGVPVVATSFPALEIVSNCTVLDDWDYGLLTYLSNKDRVSDDIAKAEKIIETNFSGASIAKKWSLVLRQLVHCRPK